MARMGRPPEENAKRKVLSVRLDPDTYKRLLAFTKKRKMTMSDVALRGMIEFMDSHK